MVQEKAAIDNKEDKGDEDAKKWVHIPREELLSAYGEYYTEIENRQNEENKNNLFSSSPPPQAENSI